MSSCIARVSREREKRLSQPGPDRISLMTAWPDQPAGANNWEAAMAREVHRDPESTISRRTLVQGLALGAAATVAGAGGALAQGAEVAPPTTITSPPRDFSPRGAPTTYFW